MIQAVLVIVAFTLLNHVRGGFGLIWAAPVSKLPGRPLFWASAAVALLAWVYLPWYLALAFGVGYLIWGVVEWGRWFDLNHFPDSTKPATWFSRWIEDVSGDNDAIRFSLRNFIMLLPISIFVSPVLIMLTVFQLIAYEIAWLVRPDGGIGIAELIMGAFWGAALVLIGSWPDLLTLHLLGQ